MLAACRGFNCTLTRAMDGRNLRCSTINCHFLRLYSAAGRGIAAVISAIEESDLYLFTHWLYARALDERVKRIYFNTGVNKCS